MSIHMEVALAAQFITNLYKRLAFWRELKGSLDDVGRHFWVAIRSVASRLGASVLDVASKS
jgi:hypothetical protein